MDGSGGVVKLPATDEETQAEAAALTAWRPSQAAVQLIDVNLDDNALLLERLQPGIPLPGGYDPAAVKMIVDRLHRLHRVEPGRFPFPNAA